MRAAIYSRVSTEKQAYKYSLPTQRNLCKELCEREKWQVVGVFEDAGISGCLIDERPDFMKMLGLVQQKKIDVIVTTDSDRFFRPENHADLGRLHGILITGKAKLATISGKVYDLSNEDDWFMSSLESLLAGKERKKIRARVARVVMQRKLDGHYWGMVIPSGYEKSEDSNDTIVKCLIRKDKVGKKGHKYTIYSSSEVQDMIAGYLNGEAVISIARRMGCQDTTVAAILDRALFYAGYILSMKDNGSIVGKGLHVPLITEEQARKVLRLRGEIQKAHQISRNKYPCLGLIKCGICGSRLHLKLNMKPNKKYYHYVCGSRKLRKVGDAHRCTLPTKPVHVVEDIVWNTLEMVLTKPESVFAMMTNANSLLDQSRERLTNLEKELSELTGRRKRIMNLYENAATVESQSELLDRYQELEKTMNFKSRERDDIKSDVQMQEKAPRKHKEIRQTLEIIHDVVTEGSPVEKGEIIRLLFDSILLYPEGQIQYKLQVPIWDKETSTGVSQEPTTAFSCGEVAHSTKGAGQVNLGVSQESTTGCCSWTNCPSSNAMCSKRCASRWRMARSRSRAQSHRSPIRRL